MRARLRALLLPASHASDQSTMNMTCPSGLTLAVDDHYNQQSNEALSFVENDLLSRPGDVSGQCDSSRAWLAGLTTPPTRRSNPPSSRSPRTSEILLIGLAALINSISQCRHLSTE
ncbi:hypothetical protein LIA77_01773 [Sarocladium implicatum]|nr:hypothetical protein LIA77_01773 [Sarocladium implicatum]